MSIFRTPAEESADLYPGLVVHDGRVTGSITVGATRLPLWVFVQSVVRAGWEEADADYDIVVPGLTMEAFADFLYYLMQLRGEFGRLLLVLANAERMECGRYDDPSLDDRPWDCVPAERDPVLAQLRRCVAALEGKE